MDWNLKYTIKNDYMKMVNVKRLGYSKLKLWTLARGHVNVTGLRCSLFSNSIWGS